MTGRQTREQLLVQGEVVNAPNERACRDQSFELPTGIYIAMATMFTGFVATLGFAFRGGYMGLVVGVIFAFMVIFFGVPATFVRVTKGVKRNLALSWVDFSDRGIITATGRSSAREATVLVLLLPFLILCFAIAIASIAALV